MYFLSLAIQLILAFGIVNVWLIRPRLQTAYRGGLAKNLKEEFQAYGYPSWFFYAIGTLKLLSAAMLLLGLYWEPLVLVGAIAIAVMMLGAVMSHIKVKDPLKKSAPAFFMFSSAVLLLCIHLILG